MKNDYSLGCKNRNYEFEPRIVSIMRSAQEMQSQREIISKLAAVHQKCQSTFCRNAMICYSVVEASFNLKLFQAICFCCCSFISNRKWCLSLKERWLWSSYLQKCIKFACGNYLHAVEDCVRNPANSIICHYECQNEIEKKSCIVRNRKSILKSSGKVSVRK